MFPLSMQDFSIEVTRRCNAVCKHCLRGDPQEVDIRDEYLERLAGNISSIQMFNITGGEPSLAIERIRKAMTILKDVEIGTLYMATNGQENMLQLEELLTWVSKECKVKGWDIRLSNSSYHPKLPESSIKIAKRNWWGIGSGDPVIIIGGRAESLADDVTWTQTPDQYNRPVEFEEGSKVTGHLMLNAFGFLIDGVARSYKEEDGGEYTISHVFEMFPNKKAA